MKELTEFELLQVSAGDQPSMQPIFAGQPPVTLAPGGIQNFPGGSNGPTSSPGGAPVYPGSPYAPAGA